MALDRDAAVDRVERLLDTVASDPMPVPVREVWVYGDVALGLDPVERLDVYVTKDLLLGRGGGSGSVAGAEREDGANSDADANGEDEVDGEAGADDDPPDLPVEGIGSTVDAGWAAQFPEHVRANDAGHAAPAQCLAAHLLDADEPVHLEVCNASFGDNVRQRLEGAVARGAYEEVLDPRAVCLWVDGQRDDEALARLRAGEFAFPTLAESLSMLGADDEQAERAAEAVRRFHEEREGVSVRGDVV